MSARAIVLFVAAIFLPSAALAQQGQFYAGIGFGQGRVAVPNLDPVTLNGITFVSSSSGKSTDTGFKVYGGYQFTPTWGLELGFSNLGNNYTANVNATAGGATTALTGFASVQSLHLAGTGTLPLGKSGFSAFGKLGLSSNKIDIGNICSGTTCVAGGTASSSRTDVLLGAGMQYAVNKNVSFRLEYEDYGKASRDDFWLAGSGSAVKANFWNLSLRYDF